MEIFWIWYNVRAQCGGGRICCSNMWTLPKVLMDYTPNFLTHLDNVRSGCNRVKVEIFLSGPLESINHLSNYGWRHLSLVFYYTVCFQSLQRVYIFNSSPRSATFTHARKVQQSWLKFFPRQFLPIRRQPKAMPKNSGVV